MSMVEHQVLRVMHEQFTPDERFGGNAATCTLSTPKDATATHILVFPTSATAQVDRPFPQHIKVIVMSLKNNVIVITQIFIMLTATFPVCSASSFQRSPDGRERGERLRAWRRFRRYGEISTFHSCVIGESMSVTELNYRTCQQTMTTKAPALGSATSTTSSMTIRSAMLALRAPLVTIISSLSPPAIRASFYSKEPVAVPGQIFNRETLQVLSQLLQIGLFLADYKMECDSGSDLPVRPEEPPPETGGGYQVRISPSYLIPGENISHLIPGEKMLSFSMFVIISIHCLFPPLTLITQELL